MTAMTKQEKIKKPHVLIVLRNDWSAITRLPAELAAAGCHVVVYAPKGFKIHKSRYVHEVYYAPLDFAEFATHLKEIVTKRPFRWITVGDDFALLDLDSLPAEPWVSKVLPAAQGSIGMRMINWKHVFNERCVEYGLPIPGAYTCRNQGELLQAAEVMTFPAILKPSFGAAGLGITKVTCKNDVLQFAAAIPQQSYPLVLQDFVDGAVGFSAVVAREGVPLTWMHAFKTEVYPVPYGPSSVNEIFTSERLDRLVAEIAKITNITGIFALDWIKPAGSDEVLLLEINGRMISLFYVFKMIEEGLTPALKALLSGEPYRCAPVVGDKTRYYKFPEYLKQRLESEGVDAFDLMKPGADIEMDVPWDDPALVIEDLQQAFHEFLQRQKRS